MESSDKLRGSIYIAYVFFMMFGIIAISVCLICGLSDMAESYKIHSYLYRTNWWLYLIFTIIGMFLMTVIKNACLCLCDITEIQYETYRLFKKKKQEITKVNLKEVIPRYNED